MPSRGASVRNGPKPPLAKLSIQTQELSRNKYEKAGSPASAAPRGARSASATPVRGPLQRESPSYGGQRRPSRTIDEEGGYPSDLYDMYQQNSQQSSQRGSRGQGRSRQQPARYAEEDDYSDYDDGSVDEGEFEMVSGRRPPPQNASMSRGQSRRAPQIRKMRIKVHATDEVRYIMVGMAVEFPDFVDRIREKFGLRRKFKIKYKDDETDGEMITMGDQDDLDMAMASSQANAKRMRQDTAKLEVSLTLTRFQMHVAQLLTRNTDLDFRNLDRYPKLTAYDAPRIVPLTLFFTLCFISLSILQQPLNGLHILGLATIFLLLSLAELSPTVEQQQHQRV
jgi:hypothetical protein